jgi:hypothetical protein
MKLQEAEDTLGEADRVKSNAEVYQARVQVNIDTELANSVKVCEDAETYSEEIQNNARAAAEALMSQTRAGAEELAIRMRTDSAEDIRKIIADIEVARASAEDELEAQRSLTETARIRAFSSSLNAELPQEKPFEFTAAPAKKRASAKNRTSRSTSGRKSA